MKQVDDKRTYKYIPYPRRHHPKQMGDIVISHHMPCLVRLELFFQQDNLKCINLTISCLEFIQKFSSKWFQQHHNFPRMLFVSQWELIKNLTGLLYMSLIRIKCMPQTLEMMVLLWRKYKVDMIYLTDFFCKLRCLVLDLIPIEIWRYGWY